MQVLVNVNHGVNKSYLLSFPGDMTSAQIRESLDNYPRSTAIQRLLKKARTFVEIQPHQKPKAAASARFVVSDSYTTERLG